MTDTAEQTQLENDADLSTPLKRVAYEAGMLLGLEATRAEQAYHRQRLNRQQYWLHGSGTLAGMAVSIDPPNTTDTGPITTRIVVGPGIGIDGLGREVNIHESYCIDLGEWLQAQDNLLDGYDEVEDILWLRITVRYHPCDVAKQPVLARKLNLSTDAVQPSRTADSILLEINPEIPPESNTQYKPWAAHKSIDNTLPVLDTAEQEEIDNAAGNPALQQQLRLHARLLHALDGSINTEIASGELEEGARLLLARIAISMPDIQVIEDAHEGDPVVNPNDIHVNNLVRPFLVTPSQLAYLARTGL